MCYCYVNFIFIGKSVLCVRKDIFKQKTVYIALIVQGWCMSRFDGSIFTHVELCNFQKYLYSTFSLLLQGVKVFFCKIFQIQARLKHAEKRSNPFEFFQICPNWTWTPCMILVVFKSRVINGNNMIFHMFSRKKILSINYLIVKL